MFALIFTLLINYFCLLFYLQVIHIERDIRQAKEGQGGNLVYKTIVGLKSDLSTAQQPSILSEDGVEVQDSDEDIGSDEDGSDCDKDSADEETSKFKNCARPRDESPESKKVVLFSLRMIGVFLSIFFIMTLFFIFRLERRQLKNSKLKAEKQK